MEGGGDELQPFANVLSDALHRFLAVPTLPFRFLQVEHHATTLQRCRQRFASMTFDVGSFRGPGSAVSLSSRLGRFRLGGGDDLSRKQEELVFVDALPLRPVTLAEQLLQLVLHALQQPVLFIDHPKQLQHDLSQKASFFRQVVGIDLHLPGLLPLHLLQF
jgi:hypothetical protein